MYEVTYSSDNRFTVKKDEKVIFVSRAFRLRVQAERKAQDWMDKNVENGPPNIGVTLEVQNLSIDPDTLFGKRR